MPQLNGGSRHNSTPGTAVQCRGGKVRGKCPPVYAGMIKGAEPRLFRGTAARDSAFQPAKAPKQPWISTRQKHPAARMRSGRVLAKDAAEAVACTGNEDPTPTPHLPQSAGQHPGLTLPAAGKRAAASCPTACLFSAPYPDIAQAGSPGYARWHVAYYSACSRLKMTGIPRKNLPPKSSCCSWQEWDADAKAAVFLWPAIRNPRPPALLSPFSRLSTP